ncbi:MAG: hypothetical protein ABW318_15855 [Vicinamibacterales bacterium]
MTDEPLTYGQIVRELERFGLRPGEIAARAGIASGTIARLRRREAVGDGETYERLLRLLRQHRAYGNASVGEL